MATAKQHQEISLQFLDHAEEELRKGDLLQASEKAWGAVSHFVNSVARQRNWPLGSHRQLIDNANRLIDQDPANARHRRRLLLAIEALHANFYHAHLDEVLVGEGIEGAKELIRALDGLNSDSFVTTRTPE